MKEILNSILQITERTDIAVIGIDGLGGAGKSTASEQLCAELETRGVHTILLHMDDFIHPKNVRYNAERPAWECYYNLQWRYDYFEKVIHALKSSPETCQEIELYDKENDSYYTEKFYAEEKTAVIVEGIFLQRKELQGLFDCMIYIDVPEDVRMRRVLKRDTYIGSEQEIAEKYENRYFPAERHYFSEYQPDSLADYVIK